MRLDSGRLTIYRTGLTHVRFWSHDDFTWRCPSITANMPDSWQVQQKLGSALRPHVRSLNFERLQSRDTCVSSGHLGDVADPAGFGQEPSFYPDIKTSV